LGATLNECDFSLKDRTSLGGLLQNKTTSRLHIEEPGMKEVFEFNHEMLGGLSIQDPQGSVTIHLQVMGPGLAHEQGLGEM
jgi:hypothetical protein